MAEVLSSSYLEIIGAALVFGCIAYFVPVLSHKFGRSLTGKSGSQNWSWSWISINVTFFFVFAFFGIKGCLLVLIFSIQFFILFVDFLVFSDWYNKNENDTSWKIVLLVNLISLVLFVVLYFLIFG